MSKGKQFRLYLLHFFKKFISPLWIGNTWRGNFLFPKDFSKKLYTFQLQGFELINTFQENCLEFPETSFRHIMSCAWPWLIKVFPEKNVLFKAILGKAFHYFCQFWKEIIKLEHISSLTSKFMKVFVILIIIYDGNFF